MLHVCIAGSRHRQPATSAQHSNSNLGAIDPIATWKPSFIPNLTLETEYLYASQEGSVINGHSASWQGMAQYLVYDFTPSLKSATRGEFFQDKDGARTTGIGQTVWEITETLSYKIPEVTGLIARLNTGMTIRMRTCSPTTVSSTR